MATALPSLPQVTNTAIAVPSLTVRACPDMATITYSASVPDRTAFPLTEVALCYDDDSDGSNAAGALLHINFTAYQEEYYYYDPDAVTNGDLYNYEVMETFIYRGTDDPQTYLEFEVSPANVTWQGFVYNPSKVRAPNTTFDHYLITDPAIDGFSAETTLDRAAGTWSSYVLVPLGLFNVDPGRACGTDWRMNFFRIVESAQSAPNQTLGSWSPPDEPNFHMTPYFGHVKFE